MLTPAIVESIQWSRLVVSITTRNIGHLQNGVVLHRVEIKGMDGCLITHLPIIRPIFQQEDKISVTR